MKLSDRIGRRMKLQELHILMTVVQAGTMKKAAALLNTSQPTVTRSIAELEQNIGVLLLDRSPHGVKLTEYGRALLKHGIAAFDELKQGVKKIEFLADPTAGEVRIGCQDFLAEGFVSSIVDRVSQRFPHIIFHLVTAFVEQLSRDLHERNVDFLIARRFGPITDERLDFESLYEDSYIVVAGAQNPWARRRKIELSELMDESWLLPPPDTTPGSMMVEAFRSCGLRPPRTTMFAISPGARLNLLSTGRFLTIFSTSVLRFCVRRPELKILPIELPFARIPIGVVTLKNRALSPVAHLFIEHARQVAKPLAKKK
jgi:DNA-binding transcriptional LysR family regulator